MVQNAVQYGAKRSAFWCKIHCVLVQNAVRFGAKCKVKGAKRCTKCRAKSINIRRNGINKPFLRH